MLSSAAGGYRIREPPAGTHSAERSSVDRDERRDLRSDSGTERASPRVIVKALLRPPLVDRLIAQALVAKYVPQSDR